MASMSTFNEVLGRTVVEFEIVNHGIEHEQYFQGCGVAFTEFEDVRTGMGDNPREAVDDAIEQLAESGWDVDDLEKRIIAQDLPGKRTIPAKPKVLKRHGDEAHYYLSIRVKG